MNPFPFFHICIVYHFIHNLNNPVTNIHRERGKKKDKLQTPRAPKYHEIRKQIPVHDTLPFNGHEIEQSRGNGREFCAALLPVEYLQNFIRWRSRWRFFFCCQSISSFVHHRKYWISITKYCGVSNIRDAGSIRLDRRCQPSRFRGKLLRQVWSASSIINMAVKARTWRGNNGETRKPYRWPDIFGIRL